MADTAALMAATKDNAKPGAVPIALDEVGLPPNMKFRIIHQRKNLVFGAGEMHWTVGKGLFHSGVLKLPRLKEIGIVHYGNAAQDLPKKIVDEAIHFLFKDKIPPVDSKNILKFEYDAPFSEDALRLSLSKKAGWIVFLLEAKTDDPKKKMIDMRNQEVINAIKGAKVMFSVASEIKRETTANMLAKIGIRRKGIPWKMGSVNVEENDHVFIGIDLGHDRRKRVANLSMVAIDNQGCVLAWQVLEGLNMTETIAEADLGLCYQELLKQIRKPLNGVTIHRDGIAVEGLDLHLKVLANLGVVEVSFLEVIKENVPILGFRAMHESKLIWLDAFRGYYVHTDKLAFLVTSDQSRDLGAAPVPIKLRMLQGQRGIRAMTEEVFWLTMAYSVNLFLPSKLPITTLLANNIAYTGDLIHFSTE